MLLIGLSSSIPTIVFYYFSLSLLSVYRLVLWGGVFGLIGSISLSLSLALPTFFNSNNNITIILLLINALYRQYNNLVTSSNLIRSSLFDV